MNTERVLIGYEATYAGNRPWRWEVVGSPDIDASGWEKTYDEACDVGYQAVAEAKTINVAAYYIHTHAALKQVLAEEKAARTEKTALELIEKTMENLWHGSEGPFDPASYAAEVFEVLRRPRG